ncbi:hypothetical protein HDK77DRAFT_307022 [Phyllosticta capitalensis]
MNHFRTARSVTSAARSLPSCRARYARPQTCAPVRFYGNSPNQTPIIQRVIFHRARHFTWRKFGTFVAFAVPAVLAFEYLSWGLDLIVEVAKQQDEDDDDDEEDEDAYYEEGEEYEDEEYDEDEDEDDEGDLEINIYILGFPFGSFLPLPFTRRQLPRDPYAPDAEIRELWEQFRKNPEWVTQYKQQLSEEIVAAASERYRSTNVRQVGGFVSETQLPAVPPREYDQLGIVLFDGLPHLERRPAPPLTLFKDAIQSLAVASGAACSFVVKSRTNQVRQFFGWHPFVIPEAEVVDIYNKMLLNLRNLQEQQARAAAKKNAALEKTGNKDSQDGAIVPQPQPQPHPQAKADAAAAPQQQHQPRDPRAVNFKTMHWSAKHAFAYAFYRDLNQRLLRSADVPRDCFSVVGTVHLQVRSPQGVSRVQLHDFNGVYNLRKRRFVEFYVRRKLHRLNT